MGLPLKAAPPVCPSNLHCSEWARVNLSYCLCGVKDAMSLTLGLISVISWGVAEVPQIITSYREKSTEGLSIAFLMAWIVGDLFNVTGCLLEPSTLPTQFYMALLYTATTAILTAQTIYYGHIYPRLKERRRHQSHKKQQEQGEVAKEKLLGSSTSSVAIVQDSDSGSTEDQPRAPSSPIPVSVPLHHFGSAGRDLYYKSARSLSSSPIPIAGSWIAHSRHSPRTPPLFHSQHSTIEPLIGRLAPTQSTPPPNTKSVLCAVSSVFLLLGSLNFRNPVDNRYASTHGMVVFVSRRLLQEKAVRLAIVQEGANNGIGTILGWAMAAIYMGGRLPQICLNIRRGNVEGLSPFMFVFALIGNATYVGSILVNSLEWHKIKPNLPWLVDAGGCVLLDTFVSSASSIYQHSFHIFAVYLESINLYACSSTLMISMIITPIITYTSCKNSLTRQTDSRSVRLFPLPETERFGWRMNFMDKAERSLEQSIWKTKLRLCSKMLKFCLLGSEPFLAVAFLVVHFILVPFFFKKF